MPFGEGHRRVRRIAAGGERVGRIFGDEPQLRHRQPHALAEIGHDGLDPAVGFGIFGLGDRLRGVRRERDLVGKEISGEIHGYGDGQAQVETVAAAEGLAADEEHGAQQSE